MAFRLVIAGSSKELSAVAKLDIWDAEIVEVAADGTQLRTVVFGLRPDIVVTELELPGDSVLDTVRLANQDGLNCKFIVMSSRRQFEYVYGAMKAGVADYLLKPVELSELENALRKVISEFSALHEKSGFDADTARNAFLVKLRTQAELLPTELSAVNGRYCTNFSDGLFMPLFIKLDFCGNAVDFQENLFAPQREIRRYLAELFQPLCFDVLTEMRQVALDVLLNFPVENIHKVQSLLPDLLHMAQCAVRAFNSATVTIAVGEAVSSLSEVDNARWSMGDAMWLRMFRGMGTVLHYADVPALSTEENARLHSLRSQAENALHRQDFGDFERSLVCFFSLPKSILSHHEARIWAEETLESFFQTNDESLSHFAFPGRFLSDTQRMLNLSSSYKEYAATYMARLKEFSVMIQEAYKAGLKGPVRDAISFVEAHYSEHLGIEDAAYAVGLSPVYFSHLFKAQTGKNFTDFVTEYRISLAKKRLLCDDTGIGEIAEAVGYTDQRYFARQFKRLTGITPSVFRTTFGAGDYQKP